uniref:Uncharacterized protein n=1 Tax=Oryza meridionalis TaxID=40149 RepID=A0A0E0EY88_9ORYZ
MGCSLVSTARPCSCGPGGDAVDHNSDGHGAEGSWDEQTTVLLKNEHLCGPAKSTGRYWYRSVPVHIWPFIPVWVERLYLITIVLMVVNGLHGQVANYKRKGREKIQSTNCQPDEFTQHDECEGR